MPELSIIMPCLNESRSLSACLQKAASFLQINHIDGEIIVADNGSDDDSVAIARQHHTCVVIEAEKGYGNAVMAGIQVAGGKYIIMGDADDSYDFSAIQPFLVLLRQ